MNRNDCEAVLHLHRTFLPRRRTGRGFLTGTVFLDTALLFSAFVLSSAHFVQKPGIILDLPRVSQADSIQFNDMVLSISREGLLFFNDELIRPNQLESVLHVAVQAHPGTALILEADANTSQAAAAGVYDAAARAGFHQIFIATRSTAPVPPAPDSSAP